MKYCKRCLYPSTKPHLWFKDGVCSACINFEDRSLNYDWDSGPKVFSEIIRSNKRNPYYDCIVPVSGGKDSTYQVWKVLQSGFNPLCVTAPTDQLTPIGRRNLANIKRLGCDHVEYSVNPQVRNQINRHAFLTVGDIQWPEHVLIYTIPVIAAVQYDIPVIIWGECGIREYGAGRPEDANITYFDRRILEEYGSFNGLRVSDLPGIDGVSEKDLFFYTYPGAEKIEKLGLCGIYLDNYFKWSGIGNAAIAMSLGFEVSPHNILATIANYENLDNYVHGIHDYQKYLKFGFSRATDVASNLIRRGLISRADAAELVRMHDGRYPCKYLDKSLTEILALYSISQEEFEQSCDDFTNYDLFKKTSSGSLCLRTDGSPELISDFCNYVDN